MNWLMSLYTALLFFVLVPGVLVSLPPGGKKTTVALTHALVFAVVYHFTHKAVWRMTLAYEGFQTVEACTAQTVGSVCKVAASNPKCVKEAGAMEAKCTA